MVSHSDDILRSFLHLHSLILPLRISIIYRSSDIRIWSISLSYNLALLASHCPLLLLAILIVQLLVLQPNNSRIASLRVGREGWLRVVPFNFRPFCVAELPECLRLVGSVETGTAKGSSGFPVLLHSAGVVACFLFVTPILCPHLCLSALISFRFFTTCLLCLYLLVVFILIFSDHISEQRRVLMAAQQIRFRYFSLVIRLLLLLNRLWRLLILCVLARHFQL